MSQSSTLFLKQDKSIIIDKQYYQNIQVASRGALNALR